MTGPKRDQLNRERIDALLDLLEQVEVIDQQQREALRHEKVRDFGEAQQRLADNPPSHSVARK